MFFYRWCCLCHDFSHSFSGFSGNLDQYEFDDVPVAVYFHQLYPLCFPGSTEKYTEDSWRCPTSELAPKKSSLVCWHTFGWVGWKSRWNVSFLLRGAPQQIHGNTVFLFWSQHVAIQPIFCRCCVLLGVKDDGTMNKTRESKDQQKQQVIQATWLNMKVTNPCKKKVTFSLTIPKRSRKTAEFSEKKLPACFCREFSASLFRGFHHLYELFPRDFAGFRGSVVLGMTNRRLPVRHFDNFPLHFIPSTGGK